MIIGIRGFIGAGKDTAANYMVRNHGFQKLSFADSLKDATANIFGWPRELLQGDTDESRKFREQVDQGWANALHIPNFTPRMALQKMGTEAGRKVFGEDVWVESTMRKARDLENVVIADVRFPNEVNAIKRAGGVVVWIVRGPLPDWYSVAVLENQGQGGGMEAAFPNVHVSEWALCGVPYDALIANDFSLNDLEHAVHNVIGDYELLASGRYNHSLYMQDKVERFEGKKS